MPKTNGHLQQNPRCMDPGVLGTFVGQFVNQLTSLGHTRLTVAGRGASSIIGAPASSGSGLSRMRSSQR